MTSSQIRQSFLDFFKSKGHTLVPSSSLMPDSPNLLFTNAGMNQFVPIFLAQRAPDVTKWAGAIPGSDTRAADTQKCIRAGGKHNDLEDVGLDTYHHTFFEMLGNWSFGDYFKQEAIDWAWELVTEVWKFPKNRLYATVYSPDKSKGDPSEFDQEAYDVWAEKFRAAGLDPKVHIVNGNKKDNFWMMGDTGPCGPCSELHVDLTPQGDTKGSLVNKGDARCIEIWNLVFIQFNANPDGTFSPLPSKHVDTGMGFERVTGIMQNTRNFTDFSRVISNYETDIFRPIFDQIEKLSGKKYGSTSQPVGVGKAGQGQASGTGRITEVGTLLKTKPAAPLPEKPVPIEVIERKAKIARHAEKIAALKAKLATIDAEDAAAGMQPKPGPESGFIPNSDDLQAARVAGSTEQEKIDVAFRVIGDHIRTLSFAIADGIQPGNTDRNYVLRRILRRAVRYGRTLGFHEPFFYKLVAVLANTMGHVFPEIRAKQDYIEQVIHREEEAFNKTLDTGIEIFTEVADACVAGLAITREVRADLEHCGDPMNPNHISIHFVAREIEELRPHAGKWWAAIQRLQQVHLPGEARDRAIYLLHVVEQLYGDLEDPSSIQLVTDSFAEFKSALTGLERATYWLPSSFVFKLYDTYGFPLDLTRLMAREAGLNVDEDGFEILMGEQRERARAAQKKQVIELSEIDPTWSTKFVGYEALNVATKISGVVGVPEHGQTRKSVVAESTPFYAEMGGQVGDTGMITAGGQSWRVVNTLRAGNAFCHLLAADDQGFDTLNVLGEGVELAVDRPRREAIQRHHTVTHLLHWALHEVVSKDATQKGSYVGPEKLTFDFSSAPLTPQQVADVERLVNERILENAAVTWTEVGYGDIKARPDIMQFFGDKYGDRVRVVQVGGKAAALDGYSMELCGGTHTRATGELGLFRIVGESAIAAGIRRIEAVSGLEAYRRANEELQLIKAVAGKVNSPVGELEKKIEALLAQQKDLEKQLKVMQQKQAAEIARGLAAKAQTFGTTPAIVENLGPADGDFLQSVADALKGQFKGVVVLGGTANNAVALVATVAPELTKKIQAGKIIQAIASIVGGKGGGRPDNARGGGKDVSKLDEALAKAKSLLG
jgi:alanyl-tRNA synthetase